MVSVAERYEELGLAEALARPYDYPAACEELSAILRYAYSKIPKGLQSLVFRDTLSAFRRLPEVQTSDGMSSAIVLVHAAATLPKQKRTLASSEFKHAVVAHKRLYKAHQDGGSMQLPQDVLVHIFNFLDMRSVLTVSLVCRAWNSAASDNMLWRLQYSLLFGKYDICCGSKEQTHRDKKDIVLHQSTENLDPVVSVNWRETFKRKYMSNPSWRFTSKRVLCGHCKSILWLSNMTSDRAHHCPKLGSGKFKIKPVSSYKVVEYLLGETTSDVQSSDSDSDSEGYLTSTQRQRLPKLWAFPNLSSTSENSLPHELLICLYYPHT